jgi:hypothetical protein
MVEPRGRRRGRGRGAAFATAFLGTLVAWYVAPFELVDGPAWSPMSLALLAVVGFAAASFVGNVGAWAALVAGHALALMLASAWTAFLAGSYAGYRSIVPVQQWRDGLVVAFGLAVCVTVLGAAANVIARWLHGRRAPATGRSIAAAVGSAVAALALLSAIAVVAAGNGAPVLQPGGTAPSRPRQRWRDHARPADGACRCAAPPVRARRQPRNARQPRLRVARPPIRHAGR